MKSATKLAKSPDSMSLNEAITLVENQKRELEILRAENELLKRKTGRSSESVTIIGEGSGLKETMNLVKKAAPTDVTVLLLGETGAGKEVIAKAVHTFSNRSDGPFLRVNCGAISPELIDSELFGHEQGAFTGAESVRIGLFERASNGTLFLDEIGEMPEEAQLRLLRVLQDGIIQRVGGNRAIKVDVRVILATHRDLKEQISKGMFRQDLWFRISTFPVKIPPLRQRVDDIEEMARHFLKRAGIRFGMKVPNLSAVDVAQLKNYSWPGNVRELAAVLDRSLLLSNGEKLDIATALGTHSEPHFPPAAPEPLNARSDSSMRLQDTIKATIVNALEQSRGRIEGPFGAATRLGMNPSTLRYKIKVLGLSAKNKTR